jgi:hypothetical protein
MPNYDDPEPHEKISLRDFMPRELTPEQMKQVEVNHWIAVILGFNEMTKTAPTLGERTYYRISREEALLKYEALTGQKVARENPLSPVVLRLKGSERLWIEFQERDIEEMRKAVAEYDAKKTEQLEEGMAIQAILKGK